MAMSPLNAAEEEVWRALVRLSVMLPRTMDDDLQRGAGLSLTHYVTLMRLSEAPGGQLRMTDLALQAELSPSRMSRVIQALESGGLVRRSASSDDGRANIASLTSRGLKVLEAAWPTHLASARTIVLDHLDPAQLEQIASGIQRVLEAAARPLRERSEPADPDAD